MGGLLILSATFVSTLLWARWDNGYVWLVPFVTTGFGFDRPPTTMPIERQNVDGVSGPDRLAAGFAIAARRDLGDVSASGDLTGMLAFSLQGLLLDLGLLFLPFAMLVIVGAANAVNLTDGLDGLAIMPVMIAAPRAQGDRLCGRAGRLLDFLSRRALRAEPARSPSSSQR